MADEVRWRLAHHMAVMLPKFGHRASTVREFETPHGRVGLRQLEVLWMLRHKSFPTEQVSPSQFAVHFGVQPSVMTRVLARLEANGLIARSTDPTDGRRWQIEITGKGIQVSKHVEEIFAQEMLDSLATLDDAQIAELRRSTAILDEVADNLQEQRKRQPPTLPAQDE